MTVIFVVIYFALFALVLYRARSPVTSDSSQANEPVSGFATDVALRDNLDTTSPTVADRQVRQIVDPAWVNFYTTTINCQKCVSCILNAMNLHEQNLQLLF